MDQVEEVKQKTDMVALVGEYVQLKKAGRNYKGLCPFHGEKSPSFMVNPELQIYKCFGCGKGGDCFTFLQDAEGMNFTESLRYLAGRVGVVLEKYRPNDAEQKREKLVGVNQLAAEAYHWLLTQHESGKKALKYLNDRGVSLEAIERYKLGFAPNDWHFLEGFLVKKKGYATEDLVAVGLLGKSERTGGYYDRFRERIMFPLANNRGQVVGFAGRVLPGADEKAGGKYVNTAETELYHKSELLYGFDLNRAEIKREGVAVIVEGELDSIASWQAGVSNVVAIKGSALTERQVELLKRVAETIVLSLDADVAGDAAARRGIEIAQKAGLFVKVVDFGEAGKEYKDPGELAIAKPKIWKEVVDTAIPIYDFYLNSAVKRFGLSVQGKKKIGETMTPILTQIEDEIVKAHYINLLAQTVGVREEDVRAQMGKQSGQVIGGAGKKPENKAEVMVKSRRDVLEEYVVGLGLRMDKRTELVKLAGEANLVRGFWKKVIETLGVEGKVLELPAELKDRTAEVMMAEDRVKDLEKEWQRSLVELEIATIREQLDADKADEDKLSEVVKLTKRLSELTREK